MVKKLPEVEFIVDENKLTVKLTGDWLFENNLPHQNYALSDKGDSKIVRVEFNTSQIDSWDSGLLVYLTKWLEYCQTNNIDFLDQTLPKNIKQLLDLSQATPEKETNRDSNPSSGIINKLGTQSYEIIDEVSEIIEFSGQCMISLVKILFGRGKIRWRDFFLLLQDVGTNALPIVSLISFLVGLIIAFLGAVVLRKFGADIYVSYLVGYGILREMGALMAGIIMAGRTGAAFAAQLGSMKLAEEINALKTLGISPIDFLVVPRLIALILMMPLLTVFADVIGILGGMIVSSGMLDISTPIYIRGLKEAVSMPDFIIGIIKGTVFGIIIAVSGCLRGIQCEESADAVGKAATSAVVTGITLIIISNAIIDFICEIFKL